MNRSVVLPAAGVALGVLVSWLMLRPPPPRVAVVELVDLLPQAVEARPSREAFRLVEATVGGRSRRAIAASGNTRVVFSVRVPEDAVLAVGLALAEEGWTVKGDGVLFRVLVGSPDRGQLEVLRHVADPFSTPADRGWHDAEVDLSDYAGQMVDIFLNTYASPSGGTDLRGDLALWGAPRILAPAP